MGRIIESSEKTNITGERIKKARVNNNEDNYIKRPESNNDDTPKKSTNNTGFGLAMLLSGWTLGIYVFDSLAIGIGLGLVYRLSFAYIQRKKK